MARGKLEPVCKTVPPVRSVERKRDESTGGLQDLGHLFQHTPRMPHVLQHAHTNHLVDRRGRNRCQVLGVIDAKTESRVTGVLPRSFDHFRGEVDPDASTDAAGEGLEVLPVATAKVKHHVGGGKLCVAGENAQAMLQQRVGGTMPLSRIGGKGVEEVSQVSLAVD